MSKRYIITLTATNRVGILAAVTTALAELGGELHEVKQTLLQKFFTMILAAEFPEHRHMQVIVDHLQGVCRPFGIAITLKDPCEETLPDGPEEETERFFLKLTGQDQPGLLSRMAKQLEQEGIEITEMYALRSEDRHSFEMVMELTVPTGVNLSELEGKLQDSDVRKELSARIESEESFLATGDPSIRWRR